MPYTKKQERMLQAAAHGAKLGKGKPSQAVAKKMLKHAGRKRG
jgi:hypothetical protein